MLLFIALVMLTYASATMVPVCNISRQLGSLCFDSTSNLELESCPYDPLMNNCHLRRSSDGLEYTLCKNNGNTLCARNTTTTTSRGPVSVFVMNDRCTSFDRSQLSDVNGCYLISSTNTGTDNDRPGLSDGINVFPSLITVGMMCISIYYLKT